MTEVIGFVGQSGSGKSFRAQFVAEQNGVRYIIDDGLLIANNRIVAGFSAKREETMLAAVRRALFEDSLHRNVVKNALIAHEPTKIMIIGTSKRMVNKIVSALELPEVSNWLFIEDFATPTEIKNAREIRMTQGKHVIPVPTFEIKPDFSGYFIDSIKGLFGKKTAPVESDRSIVRPTFSYLGDYHISNRVITTICKKEAIEVNGVVEIARVSIENLPSGIIIRLELSVKYGTHLPTIGKDVIEKISSSVDEYTAMNVINTFIKIKNVVV